jgi:hypothetical protein
LPTLLTSRYELWSSLWVADQVDGNRILWGRSSGGIDCVVIHPLIIQQDGQEIMQLDPRRIRDFESWLWVNRRVDTKEAVAAETPTLIRFDRIATW